MDKSIKLSEGLRLIAGHMCLVKEGVEAWRVIIKFISDSPEQNRLIKDYFVWVTGEYLEDKAQLSADEESAEKFALDLAKKRYEESGNQVPVENGISCSNKDGIIIVNPKTYIHSSEQQS